MPGYAIHLAIGEKYTKKNNIQDKKGFIDGIIKPDLIEKETSHYLDENGNPKLEEFSEEIYHDYNKLNRFLITKYNISIPPEIESIVKFEDGEPSLLDRESICAFIENISQIDFSTLKSLNEYMKKYSIINKKEETYR